MFNVSLLEVYRLRRGYKPQNYPIREFLDLAKEDKEQEQEVERIKEHRQKGNRKTRKYLVKWKGWPGDYNSWLIYPDLINAKETI